MLPLSDLQGYVDALIFLLVAGLSIDRSWCYVGKFLNFCYVPQQWHHELGLLRRFFARVEHKVVVGVDDVQYAHRY